MSVMAMESSFPFSHLPLHLQDSILSLLPISTLLRCSAASRSLRRLLRSPSFLSSSSSYSLSQPLFLFLYSAFASAADAYDPLLDRWLSLPLPLPLNPLISDGPLLFSNPPELHFLVSDLFASSSSIPIPIPHVPRRHDDDHNQFYPLAIISRPRLSFIIVMVSTDLRLRSTIYDSSIKKWIDSGELDGQYSMIGNSAYLDGVLYCLARGPDHLLKFDLGTRKWEVLDTTLALALAATRCLHVLVWGERLFLVGGMEEEEGAGVLVRVGIWELDLGRMEWRVHCFMPEDVFAEFGGEGINHFQTADRKGKICFVCNKRSSGSSIVMCDLAEKRWWWPRRGRKMECCSVHAVEPYIDLVKGRG